jgi:hypothetical protein
MKTTNWKDCIRNRTKWRKLVEKAKTLRRRRKWRRRRRRR